MATQSSILSWRIPMDRGVWQAAVPGVSELDMTEQLTKHNHDKVKFYTRWVDNSVTGEQ